MHKRPRDDEAGASSLPPKPPASIGLSFGAGQDRAPVVRGKDMDGYTRKLILLELLAVRHDKPKLLLKAFQNRVAFINRLASSAPASWKDEMCSILFGLFSVTADDTIRDDISTVLNRLGIDGSYVDLFAKAIDDYDSDEEKSFKAHQELAGAMKAEFLDLPESQSYLFFLYQAQIFDDRRLSTKANKYGIVERIMEGEGKGKLKKNTSAEAGYFGQNLEDDDEDETAAPLSKKR